MIGPVISYPIPAYSNVPINAEFYEPRKFFISAISLGQNTTVTTTENTNFVIGQLVRLIIPPSFGSIQLNEKEGYVLSLPSANQIVISINSAFNVNPFINSSATTKAQVLPVGDIKMGTTNSNGRNNTGTFIPGSFINISPL